MSRIQSNPINNRENNLVVIITVPVSLITLYLYCKSSEEYDKKILGLGIIGQILLFTGTLLGSNNIQELSHIIFYLILAIGCFLIKEKHNKYFIFALLLASLVTRNTYNDCLFSMNQNHKQIYDYSPYFGYSYYIYFIIISYNIFNNGVFNNGGLLFR